MKLDCGGSRCGYSGSSSECSSDNSEESSDSEEESRARSGDRRRSYAHEKSAPTSRYGGGQKVVAARRR